MLRMKSQQNLNILSPFFKNKMVTFGKRVYTFGNKPKKILTFKEVKKWKLKKSTAF